MGFKSQNLGKKKVFLFVKMGFRPVGGKKPPLYALFFCRCLFIKALAANLKNKRGSNFFLPPKGC